MLNCWTPNATLEPEISLTSLGDPDIPFIDLPGCIQAASSGNTFMAVVHLTIPISDLLMPWIPASSSPVSPRNLTVEIQAENPLPFYSVLCLLSNMGGCLKQPCVPIAFNPRPSRKKQRCHCSAEQLTKTTLVDNGYVVAWWRWLLWESTPIM